MSPRVLHLTGSPTSPEFDDLSLLYARGCLAAVGDDARFEHRLLHVSPDGSWRFPAGLDAAQLDAAERLGPGMALARLASAGVDVMVPHMFCPAGMTHFRGLFDVLGIPYVGNGPTAMALAARKDLARAVVAGVGVAVPEAELLGPGETTRLEPPVVVKPAGADNSAGVAFVGDRAELEPALGAAQRHGSPVLVERFVAPGREVRCGLLERDGRLEVLPLEEYPVDVGHPIRTAADKLARDDGGELRLVAKDPSRAWIVEPGDPIVGPVAAAARRAHRALGCRHHSLFDFRVDPAGRPWFLEASLYCSFSPQSVIATMAAAAGTDTRELFAASMAEALAPAEAATVGVA